MRELSTDFNAVLHSERSWDRVSSGLGKTLLGYVIGLVGLIVGLGVTITPLLQMMAHKPQKIEHVWMFYIGLAIIKLSGLFAWGLIIGGQFQCLMSSPERHGAKWVIFFCLTCIVMGPALYFLAWFAGLSVPINWQMGLAGVQKVRFNTFGLGMMIASAVCSVLYTLSFWYYLGVVAKCMRSKSAILMVGMNSLVLGCATAFTAYLCFNLDHVMRQPMLAAVAGGAWIIVELYWFAMIVVVKFAIDRTMKLVSNPFDRSASRAPERIQFAAP
jgi:hypothetical protein